LGNGGLTLLLPFQGQGGFFSGADGRPAMTEDFGAVVARLWRVIDSRRGADPQTSYTARLFARGRAKIAQKLGEEAVEAVIEGIRGDRTKLIGESADLIYHLFVLWADVGVTPADVAAELRRREGASGLDEKRSRANS
jgi:phosphoribosyl-ATP pyrophosphohydrolase